jgi:FixJ family two-component response regulator/DNA-binding MarR family transcriptional regulator
MKWAGQVKVAVIDDEPLAVEEMAEALRTDDLDVLPFTSPVEALRQISERKDVSLAITDLEMPSLHGLELIRKLSAMDERFRPKIVVSTGHASVDRTITALRLGVSDFLVKPVQLMEMRQSIRKLVRTLPTIEQRRTSDTAFLGKLMALRDLRDRCFRPQDKSLFGDPAWDMLLDLAISDEQKRPISVTSLCLAARTALTTGMRRIDELAAAGLLRKLPDDQDQRRTIVALTPAGRAGMEKFVGMAKHTLGPS